MTLSAMEQFTLFIGKTIQDPPDPNAPQPMSNRHATIYGVTIPFQVREDGPVDCVQAD
jgi:hypothetical protein